MIQRIIGRGDGMVMMSLWASLVIFEAISDVDGSLRGVITANSRGFWLSVLEKKYMASLRDHRSS